MMLDSDSAAKRPSVRVPGLDVARGVALVAMVVYHLAWDLSFFGLIEPDIRSVTGWTWFARAIAASFLTLVGVSLFLAHAARRNRAGFLKRFGLITGAALLVTAGTYAAMPDNFVFFGILHAIAVGSVLALPFLRLPVLVTLAFAAAVFAAPIFMKFDVLSSPRLVWLGLGTRTTFPNDFVPIFPWFGFVLLGVVLAKSIDLPRFSGPAPKSPPVRLLARAGRNSLIIYLLHQPLLFGALALATMTGASQVDREARGFMSSCQSQCQSVGGDPALCVKVCGCVMGSLKAEGLWAAVLVDRPDATLQERTGAISRRCAEAATGASPRP